MAMVEKISQSHKYFREDDEISIFEKNTTFWNFSKKLVIAKFSNMIAKRFSRKFLYKNFEILPTYVS